MGSQPLTLKCPSCKRGMWRKARIDKGLEKTGADPKLVRQGSTPRWKQQVRCLDCGHKWWTTNAGWANNRRAIGRSTSGAALQEWEL